MCAVSAITDYYREKWPLLEVKPFYGIMPKGWLDPKPITITLEQWQEYQELKKRMEEYDKATGQPDCVKPGVSAWGAEIKKIVQQEINRNKNYGADNG